MIVMQIRKFFAYNQWAWQRVFASVQQVDEVAYTESRLLFEGNIHGTLVHCMAAEYIWLTRCKGCSPDSLFSPNDFANFAAVRNYWRPMVDDWASFLQALTNEQCARVIEYKNTRGDGYSLLLADILQHVVNHATEHRSQLTPILAQLGVPTQPLDYIYFQLRI
jgi:uncharacterized damage-inducible protein DinB